MHGFGLKNLQACAERNNGTLTNEIRENEFISLVTANKLET